MTPADLSLTVLHAVRSAVDRGVLRGTVPERVKIERPRAGGRGDWVSGVALQLAREAGLAPRDIAEILARILQEPPHPEPRCAPADAPGPATLRQPPHPQPPFAAVDVTGPGFLNFTLRDDAQQSLVRDILRLGPRYGWRPPTGERAQPAYRADVRAAVTADALRRILVSQGCLVRTSCEDAADPAWTRLGVRIEAQGGRGRLATDVAPLPAPYTAPQLARRLGVDAARWGLLAAAAHDAPRLGDDLLRQSEGNPLFRVRYAHSRTRALLRNAGQLGFRSAAEEHVEDGRELATHLGDHPLVLASAARLRAPDRVARHLEATADALLDFQHTVLPRGDEKPSAAHRSRLALAEAAGTVLAGGLSLLGISAPDQM
ncbi:ArgS-related anticodon-binding protein NrtL [Streptomyces sp. NPDC054861]